MAHRLFLRSAAARVRRSFSSDAETLIDSNIHYKNAALGVTLLAGVLSIGIYSSMAVGQAGVDSELGQDPLEAALRKEAQVARDKQEREARQEQNSQEMLLKFQKGEYDPDLQEQRALEEQMERDAKSKKRWWRFW